MLCKKKYIFYDCKNHIYPFGLGGDVKNWDEHICGLALFVQKTLKGYVLKQFSYPARIFLSPSIKFENKFYQSISCSQGISCMPGTAEVIQFGCTF